MQKISNKHITFLIKNPKMFKNNEIRCFSQVLSSLNEHYEDSLPFDYQIIYQGGGKDATPHFKLLKSNSKKEYVIWVRGTDFSDPNDIRLNMMANPIDLYNSQIHRGYLIAALNVINEISDLITDNSINKIICIGHSLGGAVSSVIATVLRKGNSGIVQNIDNFKQKFNDNVRALVFATPPVFSKSLVEESKRFIINIIHEKDFVPKLGKFFLSLSIMQRKIATILMLERNCLGEAGKKKSSKIYEFKIDDDFNADQLPGKVFLINTDNLSIALGSNERKYKTISDILGVAFHTYSTNYFVPLTILVNDDDEPFQMKRNIIQSCHENNEEFIKFYMSIANKIKNLF